MNPAVMEPSHMPKMSLHTKSSAKLVQAAWQIKEMAQMKMLRLDIGLVMNCNCTHTTLASSIFQLGTAGGQDSEGIQRRSN